LIRELWIISVREFILWPHYEIGLSVYDLAGQRGVDIKDRLRHFGAIGDVTKHLGIELARGLDGRILAG